MTGLSARRARILRVRQLEHRVAKAEFRTADHALAELDAIAGRIAMLRAAFNPADGYSTGLDLKASFSTSLRLDRARDDLAAPISEATRERDQLRQTSWAARRLEDGASRLLDRARKSEQHILTLRADANRPVQRPKRRRGQ